MDGSFFFSIVAILFGRFGFVLAGVVLLTAADGSSSSVSFSTIDLC
jgi:hypothetical protein